MNLHHELFSSLLCLPLTQAEYYPGNVESHQKCDVWFVGQSARWRSTFFAAPVPSSQHTSCVLITKFIDAVFARNVSWIRYTNASSAVVSDFSNSSSDIVTGCSKIIPCSSPPSQEYSKDLRKAGTGNAVVMEFLYTEEILNYFHNAFRNLIR